MDLFYLKNAALYQKLVDEHDVTAPVAHFSRQKATIAAESPATTQRTASTRSHDPATIVTARIRPMLDDDLAAGFPCAAYPRQTDEATLDLHDLYNHPRGRPVLKSTKHTLDKLYPSDTATDMIFEDHLISLIEFAQTGGISTLFAYGQTGSGKTFTISELQKLAAVWLVFEKARNADMDIYLTIVDLAGNSAFDLLDGRRAIQVLEDGKGETHLAGAKEIRLQGVEDEVLGYIEEASRWRRTEATLKNDASSRSHCICRMRISSPSGGDGLLYLVDLAGSEAARDVAEHGVERMRETKEINVSLSVLKDCVRGKAEAMKAGKAKKAFVPIRRSMLTKVLKHVFDVEGKRDCRTVVVACVNPSLADVGASKNTLRYAEMLKEAAG